MKQVKLKMAEGSLHEKISIRDSARSLKKYGSTCNHIKRAECLVKHTVSSSDTLQGIALKYGASMEQIRRANRLWASDSLFLREYLLIPVPTDSPFASANDSNNHVQLDKIDRKSSNHNITSPTSSVDSESVDEPSIVDFLSQIDNSIAQTKKEVKKAQGNSEFLNDKDTNAYTRRKPAVSRLKQSNSMVSSSSNTSSSSSVNYPDILASTSQSHTVPVVLTQGGRKLRSSLQRLEKQQDEIFEL